MLPKTKTMPLTKNSSLEALQIILEFTAARDADVRSLVSKQGLCHLKTTTSTRKVKGQLSGD